ncbi:Uncharacterised protein [Streptococcus suis]|uniref:Uncharacterized protein n=1 Tax=Streptococcus suis TaxID=1307 RepID=A0A0Z8RJW0_STRSU|nr:Uncharacterised protein [Streptococcus suis]
MAACLTVDFETSFCIDNIIVDRHISLRGTNSLLAWVFKTRNRITNGSSATACDSGRTGQAFTCLVIIVGKSLIINQLNSIFSHSHTILTLSDDSGLDHLMYELTRLITILNCIGDTSSWFAIFSTRRFRSHNWGLLARSF